VHQVERILLQTLIDLRQGADRSAHADQKVPRSCLDPVEVVQHVLEVPRQGADLGRLGRVGAEEGLGEANRAGGEHDAPAETSILHAHQLQAPAPDVDHQAASDRHAVHRPQVAVGGLLVPAEDAEREPGARLHAPEELGLVAGVTDGTGPHGEDGVGAGRLAQAAEDLEQADGPVHGLGAEQVLRPHPLAEAGTLAELIHQAEGDAGRVGHDDQPAGV